MIDVHQNAALSESFEGDRSRVIGNRCNYQKLDQFDSFHSLSAGHIACRKTAC